MIKKKAKTFFVGRRTSDGSYEVGNDKKKWTRHQGFKDDSYLTTFCDDEFHETTGMKLRKGQIQKMKLVKMK
jgi:peroxiredoxin